MKKILLVTAILIASPSQACLIDKGGGLIYDDVADVTWLQDANYAKTSQTGLGAYGNSLGVMNWADALQWADSLEYFSYSNWRLPSAFELDGSDPILNYESRSELGHLWYSEGITPLTNGLFVNYNQRYISDFGWSGYWTGTNHAGDERGCAFAYDQDHGGLVSDGKGYDGGGLNYAWAVADGDITTKCKPLPAPIPEPPTALMFLVGLIFLLIGHKKRKKND